ncbi:MAG: cysteine hydrolase [Nanoarchaeota archaeon]|nr:cysteine hydrolase [Nanoarchaeota archaeon]
MAGDVEIAYEGECNPGAVINADEIETELDDCNLQCQLKVKNYYKALTEHVHGTSVYQLFDSAPELEERKDISALVIIDMQDYFIEGLFAEDYADMMPFVTFIIEYAMNNNLPIIIVEYEPADSSLGPFGETIISVTDLVNDYENSVFTTKTDMDAVRSSNLISILNDYEIYPEEGWIYVAGMDADLCLWVTVQSLVDQDHRYNVVTSFDTMINTAYTELEFKPESEMWEWYFENTFAGAFVWEVIRVDPPDWFTDMENFYLITEPHLQYYKAFH